MTFRAVLAGAIGAALSRSCRVQGERWERKNFRGEPVSLREGVGVTAGLLASSLLSPAPGRMASLVAVSAGAAAGFVDDHGEQYLPSAKGLSGHLGQLRDGKITTGVLKIGIIGVGAALAAGALHRPGRDRATDWVIRSVVIAGSANLINLLDLRPGRALKASSAGAVATMHGDGAPAVFGLVGTVAGVWRDDLDGRTMLGDMGANALGAALGVVAASHPSRAFRAATAVGTTALIVLSERVSFSAVIDKNPVLSAVDSWGR